MGTRDATRTIDIADIPAVILAGGLGSRLQEETVVRPKPMVEIGQHPMLWHIMKIYSYYGVRKFIVCLGYRGYVIKEFFANYYLHNSDVTFGLADNSAEYHARSVEDWAVTLVDTGERSMTGGRMRRIRDHLDPDQPFFMTYDDGVADVDISKLLDFHVDSGSQATMTVVRPPGRFGAVELLGDHISAFSEKPQSGDRYINGGFFVLEPQVLDLIEDDDTIWKNEPLEKLSGAGELSAYRHDTFWQPMDTLRERNELEALWASGAAPWKVWA